MRVLYTDRAEADMRAIHAYIHRDRPLAAASVFRRIQASAERLRDHPHMGRVGAKPGTRELVVRGLPYIVVYRVDEVLADIIVLDVLHGARDR